MSWVLTAAVVGAALAAFAPPRISPQASAREERNFMMGVSC
jgi:hypothetical protein